MLPAMFRLISLITVEIPFARVMCVWHVMCVLCVSHGDTLHVSHGDTLNLQSGPYFCYRKSSGAGKCGKGKGKRSTAWYKSLSSVCSCPDFGHDSDWLLNKGSQKYLISLVDSWHWRKPERSQALSYLFIHLNEKNIFYWTGHRWPSRVLPAPPLPFPHQNLLVFCPNEIVGRRKRTRNSVLTSHERENGFNELGDLKHMYLFWSSR